MKECLKVRIKHESFYFDGLEKPATPVTLVEVCFWTPRGCDIYGPFKETLRKLGFKPEGYGLTRYFYLERENSVAEYEWRGPILSWTDLDGIKFRVWIKAEDPHFD
jgi:hypothetical protein